MRYIDASGPEEGAASLCECLVSELRAGNHVLWLVCGGSNITSVINVMKAIPANLTGRLTVTLTDERYGPVDHPDSNFKQLYEAGFDPGQATVLPVLEADKSLEETAGHYRQLAKQAFTDSDIVVAIFGIGADGHIAGILPDSPAADEEERWAAGYDAGNFKRLTLTFPALRHIDAAYALAFGEAKRAALTKLQSTTLPLKGQPAQILKELPEVYLYSDQVKEET